MAASTNDKITDVRNSARPNSTTATGTRSAGGATLACLSLAGWPTASKVHFVTYRIDSSSNPVAGTQLDCYGIVSSNSITSFTVVDGTDAGNAVGDIVEMLPTAAWGQDLADALTVAHERTGTHKSGATYPIPVIADFTSATHTHANAAGGGLLNGANAITDGTLTPAELASGTGSTWATATIAPSKTGWSSTTKNVWQYIQMGKMVWLYFDVSGTSDSTATSVTLPVAARSISATNNFEGLYGLGVDNGAVITAGTRWSIDLSVSATTCNFFPTYAGAGWTASGTKSIRGFIIYEAA